MIKFNFDHLSIHDQQLALAIKLIIVIVIAKKEFVVIIQNVVFLIIEKGDISERRSGDEVSGDFI